MDSTEQACYTIIPCTNLDPPNEIMLKSDLEHGDTRTKVEALKKIILYILNGERLPGLLVPLIRYVLPSRDHQIKKLMMIFWEIVPKTAPDGTLLQEIILVCDAYRKDLEHPNEFVRGSTLRFLCKLKEPELLEPLLPAIKSCLGHRTPYVRRNAVLAIFTIHKNFNFLIPDAPELISTFLESEKDMSCKRNAFLMLLHTDVEKALSYLLSCLDQVTSFGGILQLMVIQLMQKVCIENPLERSRFIRVIYNLLKSNCAAVRYEAAGTLTTLSNAPTAIKAVASCYIDLIVNECDNNIKLIVLERLISLNNNPVYERIFQEMVMDVLRVIGSSDLEVKEKSLKLVLDLTTQRNLDGVILVLNKELGKIHKGSNQDGDCKYHQLIIQNLHLYCLKFPQASSKIVQSLLKCVTENIEPVAFNAITFIKEAIHRYACLRIATVSSLLDFFLSMRCMLVHQTALWIFGEYTDAIVYLEKTLNKIKSALGDIPLVDDELKQLFIEGSASARGSQVKLVSLDGLYVSQSSFTAFEPDKPIRPPLRQYLIDGEFFIGATIASTLVKIALCYKGLSKVESHVNNFISECMLIISSILRFGKSGLTSKPASFDDSEHMFLCLKILSHSNSFIENIFKVKCRKSTTNFIISKVMEKSSFLKSKKKSLKVDVDKTVSFSHLSSEVVIDFSLENNPEISLNQALNGMISNANRRTLLPSIVNLKNITQLTGYSDPVYAEACVHANQYDIILDVMLLNQTADLLQNCTLELATLGDLKLVEKPQPCLLEPLQSCIIRAIIKVSSTENGMIFGNLVYDVSGIVDRNIVVLNDIHVDIMDYIVPAECSDADFRRMWADFEWENKISLNTQMDDLRCFLDYLLNVTNMKCLAPDKVLCGDCDILAVNLYARSIFGEDALANLSLEKPSNKGQICGHIRIRAKSQGMALFLGEIINHAQRGIS